MTPPSFSKLVYARLTVCRRTGTLLYLHTHRNTHFGCTVLPRHKTGTLLYLHTHRNTHFVCVVLPRHFSKSVHPRIGGRHMTGTVLDLHITALPRHLSANFHSRQIRGSSHGTQANKNNQIKIGTPEAHSGPGKGVKKPDRKPAQLCKNLDWKKILHFPGMK